MARAAEAGVVTAALEQAELVSEISWQASELVASWRRVLNQTVGDVRPNLERASVELLRLAQIEPDSKQAIVDELANLALIAGIDDDEAQAIFARAADAPPDPINGRGKNALVAFPLMPFESVRLQTERRNYLVKGLLANTGLAVIWGPPKCGKSFWAADLGMHIALGWNYRGHRVQQATVIYVALEGRDGFPARVEAFRRRHGVENASFYLLSTSLDLVAECDELIAAIKAQLGKTLPGALFLDTLNRSLVGSESKDEDMARFLAAAERVAQELNCAVVIIHHCGIDATRPRGHTSLSGAVESQLKVERGNSGEVIVTVELAKDFAEGTEIVSRLDRVELGSDPDGDPITSLVVLPVEGSIQRRTVTRKLTPRQKLALGALDECATSSGTPTPPSLELPARTVVVQLNAWRKELYRKGVLDRDAKSPREEFKRVRQQLQARGLIGVRDELVWKA
jgi:AAA domain